MSFSLQFARVAGRYPTARQRFCRQGGLVVRRQPVFLHPHSPLTGLLVDCPGWCHEPHSPSEITVCRRPRTVRLRGDPFRCVDTSQKVCPPAVDTQASCLIRGCLRISNRGPRAGWMVVRPWGPDQEPVPMEGLSHPPQRRLRGIGGLGQATGNTAELRAARVAFKGRP